MSIEYKGNPNPSNVVYKGIDLNRVVYHDVTVWEKGGPGPTPSDKVWLTLTTNYDKFGELEQSGYTIYDPGDEVTVWVTPDTSYDPNSQFLGWYKDGELLTGNIEYTFTINEDTTLEARWNIPEKFWWYWRTGNVSSTKDYILYMGSLIYDEDGKIIGYPPNRSAYDDHGTFTLPVNNKGWGKYSREIKQVKICNRMIPKNCRYLFAGIWYYNKKPDFISFDLFDPDLSEDMTNIFEQYQYSPLYDYDMALNSISDYTKNWSFRNIKTVKGMFDKTFGAVVDLSKWNTSNLTDITKAFGESTIKNINEFKMYSVTDYADAFSSAKIEVYKEDGEYLVDISSLKLSGNVSGLFKETSFTGYDDNSSFLRIKLNSRDATDISYLLGESGINYRRLILEADTTNVTNMSHLFSGKYSEIQLGEKFVTSKVTDMSYMFSGYKKLTNDNWKYLINRLNMNYVVNCEGMFSNLGDDDTSQNLILDLSNKNLNKVKNMESMFEQLTETRTRICIIFDEVNPLRAENVREMFYGYRGYIIGSVKWTLPRVGTDYSWRMWYSSVIKGDKGTTTSAISTDNKLYARPDGGQYYPGLFRSKIHTKRIRAKANSNGYMDGDVNGEFSEISTLHFNYHPNPGYTYSYTMIRDIDTGRNLGTFVGNEYSLFFPDSSGYEFEPIFTRS